MSYPKHGKRWSPSDIRFLEENVDLFSVEEFVEILGRSPVAIRDKMKQLGLDTVRPPRNWTVEQYDIFRKYCDTRCYHEIAEMVGKTPRQVYLFAKYRNIEMKACEHQLYTNVYKHRKEIEQLAKNHTLVEVSKKLNISVATLYGFVKRYNIKVYERRKLYTKEEDEFLRKNAQNMSLHEMAVYLGRSPKSVNLRLKRIGAPRKRDIKNPLNISAIKKKCNCSYRLLYRVIKDLGIRYEKYEFGKKGSSYFSQEDFDRICTEIMKYKRYRWEPEADKILIEMYQSGAAFKEIAFELGISVNRVGNRLWYHMRKGTIEPRKKKKKTVNEDLIGATL